MTHVIQSKFGTSGHDRHARVRTTFALLACLVGLNTGPLVAFGGSTEPRSFGADADLPRDSVVFATQTATDETIVIGDLLTSGELLSAETLNTRGAHPRAADATGLRLVSVSVGAVDDLLASRGPIELRNVPFDDDLTVDFVLTPVELFSNDAEVFRMVNGQPVPAQRPDVRFFKGRGIADPSSSILLSIAGGREVFAHMRSGGETTYINSIRSEARESMHMMVSGSAVTGNPLGTLCSSGDLLQHEQALAAMSDEEDHGMARSGELIEAEIMVDINNSLIANAFGGDVNAATTYALNIVAASSAIYERDLSMRLTVSQLFYWDQQDPFSAADSQGQLQSYQQYCINERGGHDRDLAILMADLSGAGGIAYLDAVCDPQIGYAVANMEIDTTFPAQGYSWDLVVVTHELGHNFGSPHTHCYSPPIDRCFNECVSDVVPQVGTIMSYCHLGGYGIDTFFHDRVVNQIRGRILNAGCLTVTQNDGGNNEGCNGQSDDAYEPNDGLNQPRAIQPGEHQLQGCNVDVFSVDVPTDSRMTVTIAGAQGDLDLFVFSADEQLVVQSTTDSSNEGVQAEVAAGTYLIGIEPYEGQGSSYMLSIDIESTNGSSGNGGNDGSCNGQMDDAFEPNDGLNQPRAIQPGEHQLRGCNVDVFSVDVSTDSRMTVSIAGLQGDLDLLLFSSDEQLMAESASDSSNESVQLNVAAGTYLIGIQPFEGQGSAYTLSIDIESLNSGSNTGGSGTGGSGTGGSGTGGSGTGGSGTGGSGTGGVSTICVENCGVCTPIPGAGLVASMFFLGGVMRRRHRNSRGRVQQAASRCH